MLKQFIHYLYCKYKFSKRCKFAYSSSISIKCSFEGMNQIHSNTHFYGSLGYGSYISSNCVLSANVGRFTSIGANVTNVVGTHPYTVPYVSTSPCFYSHDGFKNQSGNTFATKQMFDEYRYIDNGKKIAVNIGSDCWIGKNVTIIGGICIGDGAVVLTGAIVTKDVPPYAIVGGVPAKIMKYRYDKEVIAILLKNPWWMKDIAWIKKNWMLFNNIDEFLKIM